MSRNPAKIRYIGRNSAKKVPITCHPNPGKNPSLSYNSNPVEENLILFAANPRQARQLLQSEAEKLLEEGWEVMRISRRSYIATLDGCEIYLHICSKGLSARIFQFDESINRL